MRKSISIRLFSLLLICLTAVGVCAAAVPDSRVTVNVENATLKKLFKEIESQTSYRFSYRMAIIDDRSNVTVRMADVPVSRVLDRAFKGRPLTYDIVSANSIVISEKKGATASADGSATRDEISGTVLDNLGEPAIGATVMVKGTSIGTSTDLDGRYTLANVPAKSTITFSMVGCRTREIPASDLRALAQVELTSSATQLDEVVVVGYGTQKRANLTGAVASVSQEVLKDRPVTNLSTALQGVLPNLNVTVGSGKPGASASLNIRGTTSPNGGSPLILVDGIETNLDRINANDVESVTLLKDASSAAIYGARGAFGVILITTKSGAFMQKPEVTYSGHFSVSRPTTSTEFETRGYYHAKIADTFMLNQVNTPYTSYTEEDYQALWDRRNDVTENPERPWVMTTMRGGRKQYLYLANFDWYNYLYDNTRPTWDHNLNIRGGNQTSSYMVSGRYYSQQGINRVQPDGFSSYNLRVSLKSQISPKFLLSSNSKFFSSKYHFIGRETDYDNMRYPTNHGLASIVPVNPDGTAVSHTMATNSSSSFLMDGYNALLQKGKSGGNYLTREFSTLLEGTYKISKQLSVKADFSYTFGSIRSDYRSVNVPYSIYPGEIALETEGTYPNSYKEVVTEQHYYVTDLYATYQNTWRDVHNLTVIGGVNYEAKLYRDLGAKNTGLLSEELNDFNLATGKDNFSITGGKNEFALMGLFYRAAYNYKGKYLAEVNGRYDGSSRFPRGHRFGFFPSASLGYRISEETFFAPLRRLFDNVKLRASYGSLGNQQIGYYDFIQTITTKGTMSNYTFDRTTLGQHATVSDPVSLNQTWEKVITRNLGLDIAMLNNRLTFTGEVYIRDVNGILGRGKSLPSIYGATEPQINSNDLRTKGYELTIGWNDSFSLGSHPFAYSVSASLSDYTAKYTKCDNPSGLLGDPYVGKDIGEIWGYRVDGLFASDEEAAEHASRINYRTVLPGCYNATGPYGIGVRAGDPKYLDLNGDNVVNAGKSTLADPGDRVIIGNSTPRYSYGLNLSAQWFGFDVAAFFQGIGRKDWYPGTDNSPFWGPYARPYATFVPRNFMSQVWSETNPDAYFPRPRAYAALNTTSGTVYYANDRYLQNLAYCRLKNLTVGYTLPSALTRKVSVEKCRLYVSGENLVTWTSLKTKFLDPEQACAGSNNRSFVYPWSSTVAFGLNVTF